MEQKEKKLETRIKEYEFENEHIVAKEDYLIARIDGHKFSKFTKKLNKPFDEVFSKAMIETTKDLLEHFQCVSAYTQSDEITLIFPETSLANIKTFELPSRKNKITDHPFGGRTQKLSSLLAAYASVRFNKHFEKIANESNDVQKYVSSFGNAFFDARVFAVPYREEVFNTLLFRVRDAKKNSISMVASSPSVFTHKELLGKNGNERIVMLKEKGICYDDIPMKFQIGTFVKKEKYEIDVVNQKTLIEEKSVRSRIEEYNLDITENISEKIQEYLEFIFSTK
jgi:tRNA(His) 5'-end guanylyltransferase